MLKSPSTRPPRDEMVFHYHVQREELMMVLAGRLTSAARPTGRSCQEARLSPFLARNVAHMAIALQADRLRDDEEERLVGFHVGERTNVTVRTAGGRGRLVARDDVQRRVPTAGGVPLDERLPRGGKFRKRGVVVIEIRRRDEACLRGVDARSQRDAIGPGLGMGDTSHVLRAAQTAIPPNGTVGASGAGEPLNALVALNPLLAFQSLGAEIALFALGALSTRIAVIALRALSTRVALIALRPLRTGQELAVLELGRRQRAVLDLGARDGAGLQLPRADRVLRQHEPRRCLTKRSAYNGDGQGRDGDDRVQPSLHLLVPSV